MAYVTGSAGSAIALRDAIVAIATSNGWTWDSGITTLHKGSVAGQITVNGLDVMVKAALGVSGGALVTPSAITCGIRGVFDIASHVKLSYPLTYHIFVNANPDEIVVAVNYQTSWWQWLGFGVARPLSDTANPVWQWGTCGGGMPASLQALVNTGSDPRYMGISLDVGARSYSLSDNVTCSYPFWQAALLCKPWCAIYSNLNGAGWSYPNTDFTGGAYERPIAANCFATSRHSYLLMQAQPNNWNGEAVLLQIPVNIARDAGFQSYVAEIGHLRLLRNDNLNDGQILTLGAEEWFTAPSYRKNLSSRDGAGTTYGASHSGTMGIAVRKT